MWLLAWIQILLSVLSGNVCAEVSFELVVVWQVLAVTVAVAAVGQVPVW